MIRLKYSNDSDNDNSVEKKTTISLSFRKSNFLLFTSFFLFFTSHLSYAGGVCKWTPNGVVVCNATGVQSYPHIATDGKNGAIINWQWGQGIYAQRIDSMGNCLWAPGGVPVVTGGAFGGLSVMIPDGHGGAIVTWETETSDIFAQRVDSLGNRLWTLPNGVPICTTTGAQEYPCIASDGHGGAIIAWEDPRSGMYESVYAQCVDSVGDLKWIVNGIPVAPSHDSLDQIYPQISSNGVGGAIITWMQVEDTIPLSDYDIYAQRVNASGTLFWGNSGTGVCTANGSSQQFWAVIGGGGIGEVITTDEQGNTIITWCDERSIAWDIYAQRLDTSGMAKWQPNGVPVCVRDSNQVIPSVVKDGLQGGIIVWLDKRNGNWDIYAQRVDSSGAYQWLANGVSICDKTGMQYMFDVCSDLAGGAIITWQDTVPINRNYWDIYCQRVDRNGNCLWQSGGLGVCTQDSTQQMPVVVSDNTVGGAIIAWYDTRYWSTWGDIYAQRIGDTVFVGIKDIRNNLIETRFEVYPSPFNTLANLKFQVPSCTHFSNSKFQTEIIIYDVAGRPIKTFTNLSDTQVRWNGEDDNGHMLPNGIYFCVLKTDEKALVKKVLLVR